MQVLAKPSLVTAAAADLVQQNKAHILYILLNKMLRHIPRVVIAQL